MLGCSTAHCAEDASEGEWQIGLPTRHVAQLGGLVADLVEGAIEEAREFDFTDGPRPRHRGAHRRADESGFCDRRVAYALRTEFVDQALGCTKCAQYHVFAHHEGKRVALHLFAERLVDSLYKSDLWHSLSTPFRRCRLADVWPLPSPSPSSEEIVRRGRKLQILKTSSVTSEASGNGLCRAKVTASSNSASVSVLIFSSSARVILPPLSAANFSKRISGQRAFHSSISFSARYAPAPRNACSPTTCPSHRYVLHSSSVGPSPARARATASLAYW